MVGPAGAAARAGADGVSLAFCAGTPPPSTSISIKTFPTGQTCPSANARRATRPARGDGISTVALSVMISTIGWSSASWSPSLTSHFTTSPSATPSPMSGSRNW